MTENTTLTGRTILLVHAGNAGKRFTVHKLKKLGLTIVCLNKEKVAALQPYVDHWIIADPNNAKESVEGVKSFIATHPRVTIEGALTFWEEAILTTSRLTDTFGWIGIPYEIAKKTKNKYLFRDFCNTNGIAAPRFKLFSGNKSISQIEKKMKYPMVMKPVYGAASFFVVKVENRKDIEETYEYIKNSAKTNWLAQEWENLDLLVEEYIDGEEVDIDIILQNGKIKFHTISDNFNKTRDRFFLDSGQSIPSGLPTTDQDKLISMAEETLEKLGIQNAIIHFEAKISKGTAYPIEVNMRMGGDYIYSYIKGAWDVDFVEYAAKIALGVHIKIDKPDAPKKYIVGWDLQPEFSGILVELDVDEQLKLKKYLEEMHLSKETGDPVLHPPEGYDSLGWITVSGDNLLDAQDNMREALTFIRYKIAEFNEESSLGKTARKDRLSAAVMKKDLLMQTAKIEKVRHISIKDQRRLHIGIAANIANYKMDIDNGLSALEIEKKLRELGYYTTLLDFNNLSKTFYKLTHSDIDLVLNVCEGVSNDETLKPQAAALLESLHIPYTGTNSTNLALGRDKIRMKKLLSYHNIPTAKWDYAYTLADTINPELRYPLIVKPGDADNSFGITNASVVTNKKQLEKQLKYIISDLRRPALVEEYIEGDEYVAYILGNSSDDLRVLPLSRARFDKMPRNYWHIFARDGRQKSNKAYDKIVMQNPVKNISEKLQALLTEISLDTYKIMRCRDYGRVEIRVDKDDNPYVLEADPNPTLSAHSSLIKTAKLIGLDYGTVLEEIIAVAVKRYQTRDTLI